MRRQGFEFSSARGGKKLGGATIEGVLRRSGRPTLMLLLLISIAVPRDIALAQQAVLGKYFVGSEKLSWLEARTYCQRHGGDLAKIETAEENEIVRNLIDMASTNASGCWIGASDAGHEGQWRWVDGKSVGPYANWRYGEPNNTCGGENFAHMYTDGTWNDQKLDGHCGAYGRMQPVCERREHEISRASELRAPAS